MAAASVTLERGATSVTVPLLTDQGGTPLVSRDVGKPNLEIQESGVANPRHLDAWSGLEQYTIAGRFIGSSAYADAVELADLIKQNADGTPITMNIDIAEFDTDILVAPAAGQDESLTLTYPPGQRDNVAVGLTVTRISSSDDGADQGVSTPTAAGNGPIQLTDGSTTVDLVDDVSVERSVGRPNQTIRRTASASYPRQYDEVAAAYDAFELSATATTSAVSVTQGLVGLVATELGRAALTLDFNGVYGLGQFDVVPAGSQALRQTRQSGFAAVTDFPTINLRRVHS